MATLEQTINDEQTNGITTVTQKDDQLAFLSNRAKDLDQTDMESIMEGDVQSFTDVSLHDIHGIRDLMKYRIKNNLPILPFANLQTPLDPQPLLF